jgi:hypothetical protein
MRRAALLLAALGAACMLAAGARADGDPASDYLLGSQVFLPFDAKFPQNRQREFTSLVAATNKAGYTIRVAIISSAYDMGAVTSLWRKPQTYARFLALEIGFVYRQRLLIVMPNGFGFHWPKHPSTREYALLAKIPIGRGNLALLDAAQAAIVQLGAANGVHVTATEAKGHSKSRDRIKIIVGSVVLIVLAVLVRLALRRRRPKPS